MNLFNVLSMGKSRLHETSMSAMLGYLLDPTQDHGLGSKFLKKFLEISNHQSQYSTFIEQLDKRRIKIEVDLEVPYNHRGKRNDIDIQIKFFSSKNEELHRIIIENKIRSGAANPQQLTSYYEAVLNDQENDDVFELTTDHLSVIFITPDLNHLKLREEFESLHTSNKSWIYWSSKESSTKTVTTLIQSILDDEHRAVISPINEYLRHTLKAYCHFLYQTIETHNGSNRIGEDLGNEVMQKTITIDNQNYTLLLRDSGQVQLFDEFGEKMVARPLLMQYIRQHNISVKDTCQTTRCFGKLILDRDY